MVFGLTKSRDFEEFPCMSWLELFETKSVKFSNFLKFLSPRLPQGRCSLILPETWLPLDFIFSLLSSLQINDEVNFVSTPHGSLYACIQPMHPHRAVVPTCKKMARSIQVEEEQIQTQPFHIIEMSQSQLQEMNVEGYLILQHADDQLHNLYDLDLDFTVSDVVVAALLTNSVKHTVTWFLVTAPRVPDEGDCDSDSSCVDSSSSNNATVVFPSYRASLQSGEVYFVCALLSPLQSTENALSVHEVCGDGFLVDDHPPSAGTVSILNTNDGFLSDKHRVLVSWSGFQDALEARGSAYGVASMSYSVTLGECPMYFNLLKIDDGTVMLNFSVASSQLTIKMSLN